MSIENESKLSEVSDLQKRFDEIAHLVALESQNIHAHSLATEIDPTPDKILTEEITHIHEAQTNTEKVHEPTFAQRNRIITRRQGRRIASGLLERR